MKGKRDNTGLPPVPRGTQGTHTQGSRDAQGSEKRFGSYDAKRSVAHEQPSFEQGLLLVALGALVCSYLTFVGAALVSYGMVVTCYKRGWREALGASLLALLAVGGIGYLSGGFAALTSAFCAGFIAVCVGVSVSRGLSTTSINLVIIAAGALLILGGYALLAALDGTTLSASVDEAFEFYRSQYANVSLNGSVGFAYLKGLMKLFWPTSFTLVALAYYVVARIGARGAYRGLGGNRTLLPQLAEYDVPLWLVALGILTLAVYAASPTLPYYGDEAFQASVNVLTAIRFALVVQGVAVVAWFLRRHGVSPVLTMALFIFAAFLEIQVGIVTFVGLADIWANFRRLSRGKRPGGEKTAQTKNQSASAD
ncbi:DUF2232 domain-containing protein [Lancefieldella sp. Marseille-Q7238]|uniref:DUF2232 domain-containing protein n=1 Tax=Lancefieldella sp. Marseille-Q7238 TaxID=3022127 RepID=UPI0024A93D64|nr:DUF2232 domain-containing protein [Lancefieldella sp. Marseille-Q7238]